MGVVAAPVVTVALGIIRPAMKIGAGITFWRAMGGYGCSYGYCLICSGNTLQHGHYEDGEWKERYEAPASLHCNPNCEDQSESVLFGA